MNSTFLDWVAATSYEMVQTMNVTEVPRDGDFYEEDEPLDVIRAIAARTPNVVTDRPLSVLDVAAYLLPRLPGAVDGLKIEKLCYLVQAYHLAETGVVAFREPIEAWVHGPVIPRLYREHRGQSVIHEIPRGDPAQVSQDSLLAKVIDTVVGEYGTWTGHQLRLLTHGQPPWLQARSGLAPDQRSRQRIPLGAMRDYFRQFRAIPGDDYEDDELDEQP